MNPSSSLLIVFQHLIARGGESVRAGDVNHQRPTFAGVIQRPGRLGSDNGRSGFACGRNLIMRHVAVPVQYNAVRFSNLNDRAGIGRGGCKLQRLESTRISWG